MKEVGRHASILYVLTMTGKLYVMHIDWMPTRKLDDYGIRQALYLLTEQGLTVNDVADKFGIHKDIIRKLLKKNGLKLLKTRSGMTYYTIAHDEQCISK